MYFVVQSTYGAQNSPALRCCCPVSGIDDREIAIARFNELVELECTEGKAPVYRELGENTGFAPEAQAVITHDDGATVLVALFKA